jgi:phenylalanyl-tRNA synthetase beta chain
LPVIDLSLLNLKALAEDKVTETEIIESLPYLGLDIEKIEGDSISVEYSPNRPDFCSEVGIARSLAGRLGIKLGIQKYEFAKSGVRVRIEGKEIKRVRPYIFCLKANLEINEDMIKRLIAAQEDLHNGLGRRRSMVAIGLHDARPIQPPIRYFSESDPSFAFVPLGSSHSMSIAEIIQDTEQGREYGHIVGTGAIPILVDSKGTVMSMPPIINGEATRLAPGASSVFVDVTATDQLAGETTIAILASMLSDLGARINSVEVLDETRRKRYTTPNMMPARMKFDLKLANKMLGLNLKSLEAKKALKKCRLDLADSYAKIPRYRSDIMHPVDLVEEVALGYGIESLTREKVATSLSGSEMIRSRRDERISEILVGLGLTEISGLALRGKLLEEAYGSETSVLRVENPKSSSYEYLPRDIMPSLLVVLGQSKGEEYPQRLFQEGMVFLNSEKSETQILEENHVAVLVAGVGSNFSSASSLLASLERYIAGTHRKFILSLGSAPNWFAEGRTAKVTLSSSGRKDDVGFVGEISPKTLNALGLEVPASGFELSLEMFL